MPNRIACSIYNAPGKFRMPCFLATLAGRPLLRRCECGFSRWVAYICTPKSVQGGDDADGLRLQLDSGWAGRQVHDTLSILGQAEACKKIKIADVAPAQSAPPYPGRRELADRPKPTVFSSFPIAWHLGRLGTMCMRSNRRPFIRNALSLTCSAACICAQWSASVVQAIVTDTWWIQSGKCTVRGPRP